MDIESLLQSASGENVIAWVLRIVSDNITEMKASIMPRSAELLSTDK